jgi:hypothetical protein
MIFGSAPDVDLFAVLKRQSVVLEGGPAPELLAQCGEEMQRRGGQITAAGKALEQETVVPGANH